MIREVSQGLWLDLGLSSEPALDEARQVVRRALTEGDPEVYPEAGGVMVLASRLRSWDDAVLLGLGVRRFVGRLVVEEEGLVGQRYGWLLRWDGQAATVDGAWLRAGEQTWLLDANLVEVVELARGLAGLTRYQQFGSIAQLRRLAARDPRVELTRRLLSRTILQADGVRLLVERVEDGSVSVTPRLVYHGPDGTVMEVELDPGELLKASQQCLAQDGLVAFGKERYLALSAPAARNTLLALAFPTATAEVREQFLENPLAFLPDEAAFDEADYSARVIGVGEAQRGPGPAGPQSRDWADVPEGLVLVTPNGEVVVPLDELEPLRQVLTSARDAGRANADWKGTTVPATEPVIEAVERALREKSEPPKAGGPRSPTRVLLIADNEAVLDWAPDPTQQRAACGGGGPPLKVTLQRHQVEAIERLQDLWSKGGTGALLCDDMGLGKTLQALVFAAWVAEQLARGARSERDQQAGPVDVPVALVAPPSLLAGWVREMEARLGSTVFPRLLWGQRERLSEDCSREVLSLQSFLVNAGGKGQVLEAARVDLPALRAAAPSVLLIGYDTLRRYQFAVGQVRFGVLLADEAHEAKDPNALRSRALRAMKYDFGLALTGTPIENSWRDLWTLCDFAVPGRLGTLHEFNERYPPAGRVRQMGAELHKTLDPVMVRRTRRIALKGLPELTYVPDRRAMPPDQALAYRAELVAHQRSATGVLGLLQQLARVSLHPRVRAELSTPQEADAWAAESARTLALWDALKRYRQEGAAVLVFVRSKAMQETLQRALQLAFGLPSVGVLNGDLGMRHRQQLVDHVARAQGFRVLLVSPDVGGAGWNLQFATRAILLERPYNPAVEAQMVARIHRIGQTSPVQVVAPIAQLEGLRTFDDVLDDLLAEKRELSESVLAPTVVTDQEITARFSALASSGAGPAPSPAPPEVPPPVQSPPEAGVAAAVGDPSAPLPGFSADRWANLSEEERAVLTLLQQNGSARATELAERLKKNPGRLVGLMVGLRRTLHAAGLSVFTTEQLPSGETLYRYLHQENC